MAPAALSFDANRFPNKVRASNDRFAVARAIGTVARARSFKYLYDEAAQVVADESLSEPLSNPAMVITTFSQHRLLIIRHFDYLIAHDAAGIRMPDELCHFHAMLPAVRRVFKTENEYSDFFDLCCFKEGSVPKYKPPASCPDTFPDYVPVVQPTEKRDFFLNWRGFDPKLLQEAFEFCTQVISNVDFVISPTKVESFFKSFRQALASDAPNFVHMARDDFPDSLQVLYIGLYTAAVSLPSKKKASVLKDLNWMKDNPVLALESLPNSFVLPPGPKPKPIPPKEPKTPTPSKPLPAKMSHVEIAKPRQSVSSGGLQIVQEECPEPVKTTRHPCPHFRRRGEQDSQATTRHASHQNPAHGGVEPLNPTKAQTAFLRGILDSFPQNKNRRTEDGQIVVVEGDIHELAHTIVPPIADRCIDCVKGDLICRVQGLHGSLPPEYLDEVFSELSAQADSSSFSLRRDLAHLKASAGVSERLFDAAYEQQDEHCFMFALWLVSFLGLRRSTAFRADFFELFDKPATAELLLRIAAAQRLTADSLPTRDTFEWVFAEPEQLTAPIDGFDSAWDYYAKVDSGDGEPTHFLLLPANKEAAMWLPLEQLDDYLTAVVDTAPSSSKKRRANSPAPGPSTSKRSRGFEEVAADESSSDDSDEEGSQMIVSPPASPEPEPELSKVAGKQKAKSQVPAPKASTAPRRVPARKTASDYSTPCPTSYVSAALNVVFVALSSVGVPVVRNASVPTIGAVSSSRNGSSSSIRPLPTLGCSVTHAVPMVFTELWYWLKINGLEPWMFYDCDEEGWPAVLTEPIRGYISSSYDRTLLFYLQSLFLHEGRLLLLADVRNRLSTLSRIDCPPSHYSSTVEAARQDPSLIVRRSDRIF
ncbi:hypothetical protein FB45DRAFT_1119728 [Roridomyces roridus]|uniref:Uncharacterized protein n=1 Tax=Roridomyces roridus TaxID=1738132 RepID=A0AAD7B614_9AGAR|nr:hypothetical protein FB45DRAFT_1119728 [Roridomyces roridus]